jgi:hypothetical protein
MHGTALIDSRCERGLVPEISQHADSAVEFFFGGICAEMLVNVDLPRRATFTGRFRLRQRHDATIFVLDVESVTAIQITPKRRP